MKPKCPHPGLRDLRERTEAAVDAKGGKRKRPRKKATQSGVERAAPGGTAPDRKTMRPPDDIERESVPEAADTEGDVERD